MKPYRKEATFGVSYFMLASNTNQDWQMVSERYADPKHE